MVAAAGEERGKSAGDEGGKGDGGFGGGEKNDSHFGRRECGCASGDSAGERSSGDCGDSQNRPDRQTVSTAGVGGEGEAAGFLIAWNSNDEIRNPKSESIPNAQIRMSPMLNVGKSPAKFNSFGMRTWNFGRHSDFEFRISS